MAGTGASVAERIGRTAHNATIASVMVHVDFDPESDNRIRIAANLASGSGATLIGVAGWVPGREEIGRFAAELERPEERRDRVLAELDRLGEHFRDLAHRTVREVEWRGSFHFPHEVISAQARAADLVVIAPHTATDDIYHTFDPGTVLLNTGRPVLVVPDGVTGNPGQRVLVAWKDSREARHAVQSALPYLKMAKHIALVQVAEDVLEGAAREQLSDVAKYLRRHGIAVNTKAILHPQGSVSEQLRSAAKEEHADLIVAGAYGHSRLGEWIFGGVTQNLLRHSTVCCLLCN